MRKFIIVGLLASLCATAFAAGPKKSSHKMQKRTVYNANPQHAGYPKADKKGDFPMRVNPHEYVITTQSK